MQGSLKSKRNLRRIKNETSFFLKKKKTNITKFLNKLKIKINKKQKQIKNYNIFLLLILNLF